MKKRLLSILLTIAMVLTMNTMALAETPSDTPAPNYLTFTAVEAGSTISFKWLGGSDVQYSLDQGKSWTSYTMDTKFTLSNEGDTVSFKAKEIQTGYEKGFYMSGKLAASGSVTSLTDENGGDPNVTLNEYCYDQMFAECGSSLVKAPELPATTLAAYCYRRMFAYCAGIKEAPKLPATTMARECYSGMFYGCINLEEAPKLPATTLAVSCYIEMFSGCTNLKTAPKLPATTLAVCCYNEMFYNCANLKTAPELPATTMEDSCYYQMFFGCASLELVPEIKATTLADYCCTYMFSNCEKLQLWYAKSGQCTKEWEIPATVNATDALYGMFTGCPKVATTEGGSTTPKINTTYYTKDDLEFIDSISLSVKNVKKGKKISDISILLPEDAPYTLTQFKCEDEPNYREYSDDDVMDIGNNVSIRAELQAKEGYGFTFNEKGYFDENSIFVTDSENYVGFPEGKQIEDITKIEVYIVFMIPSKMKLLHNEDGDCILESDMLKDVSKEDAVGHVVIKDITMEEDDTEIVFFRGYLTGGLKEVTSDTQLPMDMITCFDESGNEVKPEPGEVYFMFLTDTDEVSFYRCPSAYEYNPYIPSVTEFQVTENTNKPEIDFKVECEDEISEVIVLLDDKPIINTEDFMDYYDEEKHTVHYAVTEALDEGEHRISIWVKGENYDIPMPATYHFDVTVHNDSGDWIFDETNHWKQCKCGEKLKVANHSFDDGKVTKEPTYTEKGEMTYTCTVCGATKTAEIKEKESVEPTVTPTPGDEPSVSPNPSDKPVVTPKPNDTPKATLKAQKITTAKIKAVKVKTLKKKAVTIKLKAKTDGKGKLTYKVTKYPKKMKKFIKVSKTGVVTLKKKAKKGTYQITITAAAKGEYKKTTKVVSIKVM